jgi:hypothetical protein
MNKTVVELYEEVKSKEMTKARGPALMHILPSLAGGVVRGVMEAAKGMP